MPRTFERADAVELAETQLADLAESGELLLQGEDVYQYSPKTGIWELLPDRSLEQTIGAYAGSNVLYPRARILGLSRPSIVGAVQQAKAILASRSSRTFDAAPCGLTFANGYIGIAGGRFVSSVFSPDQLSRHRYDFNYDPSASAPGFQQALSDTFADASPQDAAERKFVIQEVCGLALFGAATVYQKCLLFWGEGANGKSTLLDIICAAFPPGSISCLQPQDFGHRFRAECLQGKLLNAVNEIPEGEIVASNVFKSIVSGEPITAERKHQDAFSFRPRAGHIFSANTLPTIADRSLGFWRRFVAIPFTCDMRAAHRYEVNIAARLIRDELPGIVNWLIEGALRAMQQGGLTRSSASVRLIEQWRLEADPVAQFVEEECVPSPGAKTSSSSVYARYRSWNDRNGFRVMSSKKFAQRMSSHGLKSQKGRDSNYFELTFKQGAPFS